MAREMTRGGIELPLGVGLIMDNAVPNCGVMVEVRLIR
jgi:hypothetical protein